MFIVTLPELLFHEFWFLWVCSVSAFPSSSAGFPRLLSYDSKMIFSLSFSSGADKTSLFRKVWSSHLTWTSIFQGYGSFIDQFSIGLPLAKWYSFYVSEQQYCLPSNQSCLSDSGLPASLFHFRHFQAYNFSLWLVHFSAFFAFLAFGSSPTSTCASSPYSSTCSLLSPLSRHQSVWPYTWTSTIPRSA